MSKEKVKYGYKVGNQTKTIDREDLFNNGDNTVNLTELFDKIEEKPILCYLAEKNQHELISKIIADIKYEYDQKGRYFDNTQLQNLFQEKYSDKTPLVIAIDSKNIDLVKAIFNSGYKLTEDEAKTTLQSLKSNKAFNKAISHRLLNEIEKSEFQFNIQQNKNQKNPSVLDEVLEGAIEGKNTEYCAQLINYYTRNHLSIPSGMVTLALENKSGEITKLLLEGHAACTAKDEKDIAEKAKNNNKYDNTIKNYKEANDIIINRKIALYFSIGVGIGVILLAGAAIAYPEHTKDVRDNAYDMIKEFSEKIAVKMAKGSLSIAESIATNETLTEFSRG